MRKYILLALALLSFIWATSQSVEFMPGNNFVFADVQFFKPLDKKYRSTLFSRTRARLGYKSEESGVDFFSGLYMNYTSKSGFGGTIIGRADNLGSDMDLGVHYYKKIKSISIYALPSISLSQKNIYSWFSIIKYRPDINAQWKLYTSLELFTVLSKWEHAFSTQRARLGLDFKSFQFGAAMNISEVGMKWQVVNDNYGIFLRKEF